MTSFFLRSGSRFNVTTQGAMDLQETLPADTYTVKFDKMSGSFFLEIIEGFEIKGKVYGDTRQNSTRILDTFADRDGSTGVMLSGEKGSGKTLLAKMLSVDAMKKGIPTIVINQPWCGEQFNGFMQMIEQPTVVIFDEFEKIYDKDDQEQMLTLLDGVYPSKKLYVITCNDKWRVNEHMRNRPGRIFYRLEYRGLENDFIVEYCQDNLLNKTYIESICRIAVMFSEFNFDILKALVEEMNRYDESPQEAMKMLNAKPEQSAVATYEVLLEVEGNIIPQERMYEDDWEGNPLQSEIRISYSVGNRNSHPDFGEEEFNWKSEEFAVSDLRKIDAGTGKFHFANSKGAKLSLVKAKAVHYSWDAI